MPAAVQEIPNDAIEILTQTISPERLGTYLSAAGHDPERALKLYLWNAQLGEAFHIPIQAVEVGLRNRINHALAAEFGQDWWCADEFLAIAGDDQKSDLEMVARRIRNRDLELCASQVVAGMSFGFWSAMLQPRYNAPVWSKQLRSSFPHFPDNRGRKSLAEAAARVGYIRNRIWHHEPIIKNDNSKDHATVLQLLGWICPTKAAWIRPYCRVPELLRRRP